METLHFFWNPYTCRPNRKFMRYQVDFICLKGSFFSKNLNRSVTFRWVAPPHYEGAKDTFPVLMMNDGQDFNALNLERALTLAYANPKIRPFIYVGIEANENRLQEYGTAAFADFKGRGSLASKYSDFVMEEFIPFLKDRFKVSDQGKDWVFGGLSLGGLSAFDIAFNNFRSFGKVGVFSGSFWWRKKAYIKKDMADRSRIVLDTVKNGTFSPHLKFWFQCGTEDETADRNNNGIIDAIDDTLDLIKELSQKGYTCPGDITYVEIEGGKHDMPTWGRIFPAFIEWAFGTKALH